jgi:hypothetical protein
MTLVEHRMRTRLILGFVFMFSAFGVAAVGWPFVALALDMLALWFFVAVMVERRK